MQRPLHIVDKKMGDSSNMNNNMAVVKPVSDEEHEALAPSLKITDALYKYLSNQSGTPVIHFAINITHAYGRECFEADMRDFIEALQDHPTHYGFCIREADDTSATPKGCEMVELLEIEHWMARVLVAKTDFTLTLSADPQLALGYLDTQH